MRNFYFLLILLSIIGFSQENRPQYFFDFNYYYGSILPHSDKILHLITDHPEGILISANRKTFGDKEWESRLGYPDYGISFHYQNNKNKELGNMYGIFGHYNFYFFKRNLQLRIGQGVAYNTNPYDKEKNYRNLAYGTHLMPSSFFMLNYDKQNIWDGFGLRAGIFIIHHSNGTIKTPNTSANTLGASIGIQYVLDNKDQRLYTPNLNKDSIYREKIRYNFVFRSGVHESHIFGSGQYPFYVFSGYADKRFSRSSSIQTGIDVFLSMMLKHEIEMMSVSFPENGISKDTDFKRIGAFVGYELFVNQLSAEGQLGVYIYDDYKSHTALFQRLGLKYYFYRNFFTGMGLKTHFSKAEAMEFSIGIRI